MASCEHPESERVPGPREGEHSCRLCGEIELSPAFWTVEIIDGRLIATCHTHTATKPLEEEP